MSSFRMPEDRAGEMYLAGLQAGNAVRRTSLDQLAQQQEALARAERADFDRQQFAAMLERTAQDQARFDQRMTLDRDQFGLAQQQFDLTRSNVEADNTLQGQRLSWQQQQAQQEFEAQQAARQREGSAQAAFGQMLGMRPDMAGMLGDADPQTRAAALAAQAKAQQRELDAAQNRDRYAAMLAMINQKGEKQKESMVSRFMDSVLGGKMSAELARWNMGRNRERIDGDTQTMIRQAEDAANLYEAAGMAPDDAARKIAELMTPERLRGNEGATPNQRRLQLTDLLTKIIPAEVQRDLMAVGLDPNPRDPLLEDEDTQAARRAIEMQVQARYAPLVEDLTAESLRSSGVRLPEKKAKRYKAWSVLEPREGEMEEVRALRASSPLVIADATGRPVAVSKTLFDQAIASIKPQDRTKETVVQAIKALMVKEGEP